MKKGFAITLFAYITISCTSATKEKIVDNEALFHAAGNSAEWLSYVLITVNPFQQTQSDH
jgi:hypothetical protein